MSAEALRRVESAIEFALGAHRGQVYRGFGPRHNEPFLFHVLRVAMAVPYEYRVVAVLHDCLEDFGSLPNWTTAIERGAIKLLTRTPPYEYAQYIEELRTAEGPEGIIARAVKIADLRDNLSNQPPERLRVRYEAALAHLGWVR